MSDTLLLCSQSESRAQLLKNAKIKFKIIKTVPNFEEPVIDLKDLEKTVTAIAWEKMNNVDFSALPDNEQLFITTADTLVQSKISKQLLAKPIDLAHAREMIELANKEPLLVGTSCILRAGTIKNPHYSQISTITECIFKCDSIDRYLANIHNVLSISGAVSIEGFGLQFFPSIHGSLSGAQGLPLPELIQHLSENKFKF